MYGDENLARTMDFEVIDVHDVHDVQSLQDTEEAEKFRKFRKFSEMQEAIQRFRTAADKLDNAWMEVKVLAYWQVLRASLQ